MGGRTFDQFMSRQKARTKDRQEPRDPSPSHQEKEQDKYASRQPLPVKK